MRGVFPSWGLAVLLLLAIACIGHPPDTEDVTPALTTPTIAAFAWTCDASANSRALDVTATSWTGGGSLFLTVDGGYVEDHPVRVVRSEPDGSAETLHLDLSIVGDWRDAASGASTAFLCADHPSLVFVLHDLAGDTSDCRTDGDSAVWARVTDAPTCDVPVGDTASG